MAKKSVVKSVVKSDLIRGMSVALQALQGVARAEFIATLSEKTLELIIQNIWQFHLDCQYDIFTEFEKRYFGGESPQDAPHDPDAGETI